MSERWTGHPSQFPWEEEALRYLREKMPSAEPFRAWSNFTFTARSGHIREVDLLIAVPRGLFLVEIKGHPGRARNNGGTWLFHDRDHIRSIENPLHLTDLKCKQLRQQLEWAARELGAKVKIPFIAPAVFLSSPDLRCEFDDTQRIGVYGRDELRDRTGLPGIWCDLLDKPGPAAVTPQISKQLPKLLAKMGVGRLRKHRKVGPFQLESKAFDTGPTWEDYLAENPALPGDPPRRIRIYLSELDADAKRRESTRRAARREYLALQGISHEGIVQAEQFSEEHEAGPSIVFRHGAGWRRLDHFMAEQGAQLPVETRLEMVRQLGEALDHAHRRHLHHRALAARSVYVEMDGRYPRLRVCDWQVAARVDGPEVRPTLAEDGVGSSLASHIEAAAGPYLAPEFGSPDADGTQLDVFGLGALSHLILTGRPPAAGRKALADRLRTEGALNLSAVSDEIATSMDDLVRGATRVQPADRFESVREFLDWLELVEEELTSPATEGVPDLLEATRGAVVDGWTVERQLGKGSTAKALLVRRDGHERVLKVALNDAGRERLEHEAARLRELSHAHIVRLIDGPVQIGPRTALVLERAGEQTLAQYLKHEGRLTIDELEALGDQLFRAVEYLEDKGIRHRDIKPDNLGVREQAESKKGRRLVLFDFSLAGAADQAVEVGTPPYLDPFLGTDRRPLYDAAAERYAVAVTLHEMASAELPSWGDGVTEPRMLPDSEQLPQLAEDGFDPTLRDRLVRFFTTALHRDPDKRHASLQEMRRAWADVFRDLDAALPLTTPHTVHQTTADPQQARQRAAELVTAATPLVAAGLSARALSTALQQLEVSTVGELVRIPAARIQRLRGVGLGPRNELVKRAREWREQLAVSEQVTDPASDDKVVATGALHRLGLDEVAAQLVPRGKPSAEQRVIRLVLALPGAEGQPAETKPWDPLSKVAQAFGSDDLAYVGTVLAKARQRWTKDNPALTALRRTVLELLVEHGRVMEAGQLAAALLTRRGCVLNDPQARLTLAAACLRAAVEAEELRDNPRLVRRRHNDKVLIASVEEVDATAPSEEELLDYAVKLGERADELVDLSADAPLPSLAAVRAALLEVPRPEGAQPLSDTDLIALAAGASRNAAVTARLELYPRDLDPSRALRLAQVVSHLRHPGIEPERLRERVLARFPELTNLPEDPAELRTLLLEMGEKVEVTYDERGLPRYVVPGVTRLSAWSVSGPGPRTVQEVSPADEARTRLLSAAERGGFLAVKAWLHQAAAVRDELTRLPSSVPVTPVNVTESFVTTLRAVVAEQGRPRWETVLAADTANPSPAAKSGFTRLLTETWARLERRIRAAEGVVLLHDATALARYEGGMDLLTRLKVAAGQPDENPYGLWLLCPMHDPAQNARLDEELVGVLGENQQLAVPSGFINDMRSAS
ncbi:BREX system serine/threonine kinase PglW [Thermomonospora amylolytica]|uniref:BREX system serine/threonine kinase PglW n=1 Tax=Thermomonospora amylolytica TaxID=1411117 RepID=UPI001300B24F|nr:BREX system serine/threonine kinase PglW [Thermomonospora amylolytica]